MKSTPLGLKILKIWILTGIALSLLGLAVGGYGKIPGAGKDGGIWKPMETLMMSPKWSVRYPANAGAFLGGIAAAPVAVALLPITIPVSRNLDGVNFLPIAPAMLGAQGGAVLLGGPFWLLLGRRP